MEQISQHPLTLGGHASTNSEGSRTITPQDDPFVSEKDAKKHKAGMDVFSAFIGHPKKHDPAYVQLKATGWTMAKRVFHPKDADK